MYQVRRLQLTAQTRVRKPLIAILKSGLRPTQQCNTIVTVKAATEKKEDAMSYSIESVKVLLEFEGYVK
jgi:hypothetical protein